MDKMYANYNDRVEIEKKANVPFIDSIRTSMKRLQEYEKMPWTKGDYFRFREHDYNWFLDKIAGNRTSKYNGCQVFIPETVIFSDGKPEKVIKTDDNGFVTTIKGSMNFMELRKYLESVARDRKREQEKKEMQLRYERSAAIKKAAQAQEADLGDVFLFRTMDMLQPEMAGPRHSAAVSEPVAPAVVRSSLSID